MSIFLFKEIGAVFKAMGIEPQQEVLAKWLNDFDSNRMNTFFL